MPEGAFILQAFFLAPSTPRRALMHSFTLFGVEVFFYLALF